MKNGREKFRRYKPAINILTKIVKIFPVGIRLKSFEHFRMTKGTKGIVIRYILIKTIAKKCGNNVSIHPGVYFINVQNIELGNNVSIHPMCYIDAAGDISIGNNVSIAHAATILSTNHTWENEETPIKYNEILYKSVDIHDDVWIGCGSRILAGAVICSRSVIAAGAVVINKVHSNTIVGGVPAKIIKKMDEGGGL